MEKITEQFGVSIDGTKISRDGAYQLHLDVCPQCLFCGQFGPGWQVNLNLEDEIVRLVQTERSSIRSPGGMGQKLE